jgi:hypothetical protein
VVNLAAGHFNVSLDFGVLVVWDVNKAAEVIL